MLRRLLFQNTYRPLCVASVSAAGFQRHQHHHHRATVETSSQGTVTAPLLIGTIRQCATNNNNNSTPRGDSSTAFELLKKNLADMFNQKMQDLPENDNNKLLWNGVLLRHASAIRPEVVVECYFEKPTARDSGIPQRAKAASHVLGNLIDGRRAEVAPLCLFVMNVVDECYKALEPNQQRSVVKQSQSSAVTRFARLKTTLEKLLKYEIDQLPENNNNKVLWNKVATFQESIATAAVESYFRTPKFDHGRIPPRHDTRIFVRFFHSWLCQNEVPLPRGKAFTFAEWLMARVDECYRELSHKVTLKQIGWKRRRLFGYFDAFVSQANAEEISNRHDQNSSFAFNPRNSRSFDELRDTWRIYSVILLCGSSGSGKTVMALDVAHSTYHETIVFYLKASDLARGVADSGANRDEIVMDNLLNACECTMDNGEVIPPSFDNIEKMNAPGTHVIIVVDDCGTEPEVLQGLFATSSCLSVTLHNKIFTDSVSERDGNPRVRFVACTTGAAYATYGTGSKPDYLSAFYLDEPLAPAVREENVYDSLRFTDAYRGFHNKELWNADEKTFLERLSPFKTDGKLSIAEERMKDIVKNARAAASFLEFCKQAPRNASGVRTWATSLPAFRQFVSASIPMVTQSYFRANTLWKHVDPTNWLALATAFAFHRFPFAPATLKPSEIMRALPKSKKEMDDSLAAITHTIGERNFLKPGQTNDIYDFLCTKGGLFVDIAEKTPFVPTGHLQITNFIPKCDTSRWSYDDPEKTDGCRSFRPRNAPGRFHLPRAQAAMAFSSVGLRSDSRWSRTEHLAADVCTVLAGSSRAIHNLYDAVNAEMQHFCGKTMKDYHALVQTRVTYDPLFALKQLLLFDRSVESAEYHRLRSTPMSQTDAVLIQTNQNVWQSFKDKYSAVEKRAIEVNQLLEKALSENKAVVLQTPDMEPFVDIVVVGPGRVILIRSKSNVEKGNLDYFGELLNMRVLNGDSFVEPKNNRYRERIGNMFRELWLAAILHAADRSSEKGEFETWLEAKPRTWSKSEDVFNNGLNLDGTCPWTSNVDLHVCFFVEAVEYYDLSTVGERFRATVEFDEKKIPVSAGEIKWRDEEWKPKKDGHRLKFRRDLGLKSVELVAFERDCSECPRALAPFTMSSVSKSKIQRNFKGAWKISEKF